VASAAIGETAYIVGGYNGEAPLSTILAFRPGAPPQEVRAKASMAANPPVRAAVEKPAPAPTDAPAPAEPDVWAWAIETAETAQTRAATIVLVIFDSSEGWSWLNTRGQQEVAWSAGDRSVV